MRSRVSSLSSLKTWASSRTTGSENAGMAVREWPFDSPERLVALFLAMVVGPAFGLRVQAGEIGETPVVGKTSALRRSRRPRRAARRGGASARGESMGDGRVRGRSAGVAGAWMRPAVMRADDLS